MDVGVPALTNASHAPIIEKKGLVSKTVIPSLGCTVLRTKCACRATKSVPTHATAPAQATVRAVRMRGTGLSVSRRAPKASTIIMECANRAIPTACLAVPDPRTLLVRQVATHVTWPSSTGMSLWKSV